MHGFKQEILSGVTEKQPALAFIGGVLVQKVVRLFGVPSLVTLFNNTKKCPSQDNN